MENGSNKMLTEHQAAQFLNVTLSILLYWHKAKKIPAIMGHTNKHYYYLEDLKKLNNL